MRYCHNCGASLPDGVRYCANCGRKLEDGVYDNNQEQYYENGGFDYGRTNPDGNQYPGQNQYQNQYQYQYNQSGYDDAPQYGGQNPYQGNQGQYNQNAYVNYPQPAPPATRLKTDRNYFITLLLSLITLNICGIITYANMTDDVNAVCSRYDGKKSMNYYLLYFLVGPVTLGIAGLVWFHNICARIGNELERRNIGYGFGAKDFWLWNVLGCLIIVGPFVFGYKFFKAVNILNADYNLRG